MTERTIVPWFGGAPIAVEALADTDKVAFSWTSLVGEPEGAPRTIAHLLVWHDCDRHVWLDDPAKDPELVARHAGWHPAGVGLHDLMSAEPLHLEPSLYWPDCCGMHGWIRDGRWVPA